VLLDTYRILRTIGAHTYGQAITLIGIYSFPAVAILVWGPLIYGYWVSISALAQFFIVADLGASLAIANHLCMNSSFDENDALKIIRYTARCYFKKILYILLLVLALMLIIYFLQNAKFSKSEVFDILLTFFFLAFSASLQPALSTYASFWRFSGKNEVGVFILNTIRLFEFLVVLAVIFFSKKMYWAALSSIIVKCFSLFSIHLVLRKSHVKNDNNSQKSTILVTNEFEEIKKAGFGFVMISFAQQLIINGPVLIIATILGPLWSAIFSACRTLSRLPVQPLILLLTSLSPEVTALITKKEYVKTYKYILTIGIVFFLISTLVGLISLGNLGLIEKYWLLGKLHINRNLLILLCIAGTFHICGQAFSQPLTAINKTFDNGLTNILVAFLSLFLMYIFLIITKNIIWAGFLIMLSEVIFCVIVFKRNNYLFQNDLENDL
jgi:O-antigen/teichoic acid export membrane protein